ncbi:zinc ribbon domain-containing protein [Halalkalibacillus halophilus]|uniref:zinc ribbon domain-containing protein n=1 Tax=Halalkalibacillus halophilus TaxID=392827 RepID=UPI00040D2F9B|nr:zinc ribbon domain-containing protein [Halalkalibacillus halophilus]
MYCEKCGYQVTRQNFCENCGAPIEGEGVTQTLKNNNETKVRESGNNYFIYLMNLLKNPTNAVTTNESSLVFGVLALVLLTFTFTLGQYFLLDRMYSRMSSGFTDESWPLLGLSTRIFIGGLLIVGSGLLALILTLKVGKVDLSLQRIVAQAGALAVPFIVVTLLSMVTGLAYSAGLTTFLGLGGLIAYACLSAVILSLYHLVKENKTEHFISLSLGSFALTAVFIYLTFEIYFGRMVEDLMSIF